MKHRVAELEGALLDRTVGMAAGEFGPGIRRPVPKAYTSDWAEGGPIIERERMHLIPSAGRWHAAPQHGPGSGTGPTPLIAAMRAFVASKLGEEVEL